MVTEKEIKLRLFESITGNSRDLCDDDKYMSPQSVASHVQIVYNSLFNTKEGK